MDSNKFIARDNILFYDDKPLIVCEDSILVYLVLKTIIILTDSTKSRRSENVYCYGQNGNLIWQIQLAKPVDGLNYYTSIYLKGNYLMAYNFNGFEATIDQDTGTILKEELIK